MVRVQPRNRLKLSLLSFMSITLLFAQAVFADSVILRSGRQVHGTLADRERFRSAPTGLQIIAIASTDSSEHALQLLRFPRTEVQAVVLTDGTAIQVLDLAQPTAATPERVTSHSGVGISAFESSPFERPSLRQTAAVSTGLGIAALVIGLSVKFGGPRVSATNASLTLEEHSYNAANFALMGLGGALTTFGLVTLVTSSTPDAITEAERNARLQARMAVAIHF